MYNTYLVSKTHDPFLCSLTLPQFSVRVPQHQSEHTLLKQYCKNKTSDPCFEQIALNHQKKQNKKN